MDLRNMILGLLIGAMTVGGVWWISTYNEKKEDELFANKQKCAQYTEKRIATDAELAKSLMRPPATIEGFYSPVANTCMTASSFYETTSQQHILIDELSGRVEASVYELKGEALQNNPDVLLQQIQDSGFYFDQVRYFKGLAPKPDPAEYTIE